MVASTRQEQVSRLVQERKYQVANSLLNVLSFFTQKKQGVLSSQEDDPLKSVIELVLSTSHISFQTPSYVFVDKKDDPVLAYSWAYNVRAIRSRLRDEWWKRNYGPMVGFKKDYQTPVALIPKKGFFYSYLVYDLKNGTFEEVTEKNAEELSDLAYTFLKRAPMGDIKLSQLFSWLTADLHPEIGVAIGSAFAVACLGLVIPIFFKFLFDYVIQNALYNYLLSLTLGVIASAVSIFILGVVQQIALFRIDITTSQQLHSSIMERIITLPIHVVRSFSLGELLSATVATEQIRGEPFVIAIRSILAAFFSIVNIPLLFYFDFLLAKKACIFLGIELVFLIIIYSMGNKYFFKQKTDIQELLRSMLEVIRGIVKIRMSAGEENYFNRLMFRMLSALQINTKNIRIEVVLYSITIIFDFILLSFLFFSIVEEGIKNLGPGQFLGFYIAFQNAGLGLLALGRSLIMFTELSERFRKARIVLKHHPEVAHNVLPPGVLKGNIVVENLSFNYHNSSKLVLSDINMEIKQGQMVAVVGPSGAGKSTLIHLLLGFEKAFQGNIYYDNQEINVLNHFLLRRQMGVVLQKAGFLPGSIANNILFASLLTLEDAWEALRMVGLYEDVKKMPMGLHTLVGSNGLGLSSGQKQCLMLARALVRKPNILFLDEATSALDSIKRTYIENKIRENQVTRLVVSHRLGTVAKADYIYVMNEGRICQQGTFDMLIKEKGIFADMMLPRMNSQFTSQLNRSST